MNNKYPSLPTNNILLAYNNFLYICLQSTNFMRQTLTICLFLLSLFSCKKESLNQETLKGHQINGKIEKGPFVKGSKVTVQELTSDLTPTGKSFTTSITDDQGNFGLDNIPLTSNFIEIITDGYFYNEVSGELSSSPITLTGLADISEGTNINVNILTHITKGRIVNLIKNDKLTFSNARQKAQKEFFTIFGLQDYSTKNFSSFSVAAGTNESSSQIVVSAALLKDKSPAQFTEYIADLSDQFKNTGAFTDKTKDEIWSSSIGLNCIDIKDKLIQRYASLNKQINVVELGYFIDWNHDGIAGNELGKIGQERILKFETDTLKVGKEGGAFKVKIQSNILYKTESNQPSTISSPYYPDMFTSINFLGKSFQPGELILSINPSAGVLMKDTTINIYSYDQQTIASLVIKQDGDVNKLNQDPKLSPYLSGILTSAAESFDLNYTGEAIYTNMINSLGWAEFYQKTVNSNHPMISSMWSKSYTAVTRLNTLIDRPEFPAPFKASLSTLRSIIYYQMAILWGDIPYVTTPPIGFGDNDIPIQTSNAQLLQNLKETLSEAQTFLSSQKNSIGVPVSNDIPAQILAKVLMNQKNYNQALPLLEAIINSGKYSVANNHDAAFSSNNNELIYSLAMPNNSEYKKIYPIASVLPIARYCETLLLAAECAVQLGQNSKATTFLNKIETDRGHGSKYNGSTNISMQDLQQTWKAELYSEFSYFDFLKRNTLAESILNIPAFKKLLPIPQREVVLNPKMRQNPGY